MGYGWLLCVGVIDGIMVCFLPADVDPVDVDVDAGSAQHRHDGFPVRLLDALLEDHLVRETHPSNPWVLPREERGSSGHLLSS